MTLFYRLIALIIAVIMLFISAFIGYKPAYKHNISGGSSEDTSSDFISEQYRTKDGFKEEGPFVTDDHQEYLSRDYSAILFSRMPLFHKDSVLGEHMKDYYSANARIKKKLRPGFNWTNQTLSYTCNRKSFAQLYNIIREQFPGEKYNIVDATGNIGGDSISFAMEPAVVHIRAYEILPQVCEILKNNVRLYGFKDKIDVVCGKFDYNLKVGANSKHTNSTHTNSTHTNSTHTNSKLIVIIDPPYEKGNNADHFNLSIDNMPIYEVVDKTLNAGADLVIVSMPRNYAYNIQAADDYKQDVKVYRTEKNVKFFAIKHKN